MPPTRVTTLENGLRVATETTSGETATVGVFLDSGSRFENAKNNGTAHFLEHLAFKGTPKRSRVDLELRIENMGAHLNAYTSREMTTYFAQVFRKDIPEAVDIVADIIQNPLLEKNAIEAERAVILRELKSIEDNMEETVLDRLHETAFSGTGLGLTILGPQENIKSLTQADLKSYIDTHYTPDRMVLCGAGAVDHDQLVELAKKAFGGNTKKAGKIAREPARYVGSDLLVLDDAKPLCHLAIAVKSVGWSQPESFVFMVMQNIVGSWDRTMSGAKHLSSKLSHEVSDHHLALSFSSFNTAYSDTGLFGCTAVAEPKHLDDLVYAIENEWVRLAYDVTDYEVERAKNQLKSALLLALDGTTAVYEDIGRQILNYGRRLSPSEIFRRINHIDADTVKAVAQRYIYDTDPVVAMVGNCHGAPDYNRMRKWTHWYRT